MRPEHGSEFPRIFIRCQKYAVPACVNVHRMSYRWYIDQGGNDYGR